MISRWVRKAIRNRSEGKGERGKGKGKERKFQKACPLKTGGRKTWTPKPRECESGKERR